jgi:transglutaminase-like putative cysteine protease
MRLSIKHATTYAYDPPAERCALRLRLYPPSFDSQRVISWNVSVNGQVMPALLSTATGDRESIWTAAAGGAEVAIVAEGEIETRDAAGVVKGLKDTVRPQVYLRPTPLTETDKRIEELAASITGAKSLDRMHGLFNAVADAVAYKPGATSSSTTAAQALKAGQGVCQDHAHVFIAAARVLKFPARYVVGYLLASDTKLTEAHIAVRGA